MALDVLCSLGLSCCNDFTDYTKEVGLFLSWQQLLSIGGIIFAAIQFMEAVKIRAYIYRFGWLYKTTPILVGLSTILIIISNFIQLTNSRIPFISYPAFYEILSLTLLSVFLLFYVWFLLRPKAFLTYNDKLLDNISRELLYNQSDEALSALSRIIGEYLGKIIESASRVKRPRFRMEDEKPSREDMRALSFIDVDISTPTFVNYIASNNIHFIVRFVQLAEKFQLWDSGGDIFIRGLSEVLFTNEKSLLSRELIFGGISGVQKPITNLLFHSTGMLSHYRIFNSFNHWSSEITETTLKNWINGLTVALRGYFSDKNGAMSHGSSSDALSYSLENLGEATKWIVLKANKEGDALDGEYSSKLSIIGRFLNDLNRVLVQEIPTAAYKPKLSEPEQSVAEDSVTLGIAKALFAYMEGFAWMKNEENSRMFVIEPIWMFFDERQQPVLTNIRLKVLELIKVRVSEKKAGRYASIIKLMLIIYGHNILEQGSGGNSLRAYIKEEFRANLAELFLKDKKFRQAHMPKDWFVSKDNKRIYRKIYNSTQLIYPTPSV